MPATAVYLYGVTRDLDLTALADTAGVGGAPVRGVAADGLVALVSTVRMDEYGEEALRANLEDLGWVEATARAHHDVVGLAARTAPTAPVRIATVYHDDDRVSEVLRRERERFGVVLDRIAGRSEWGVKAYSHPEREPGDEALEPAVSTTAGADGGGGSAAGGIGTAYLRRRQEQRRRRDDLGRRASERAETIDEELRGRAVAVRRHAPQDPRLSGHDGTMILNLACLLDDERVEEFLDLVQDIDARWPGVEVEVTGPWPPYSFIDLDEG